MGGAEILTHEVAKRWVANKNTVVQFSSQYPNCVNEEVVDGVRIIREGSAQFRSWNIPVHVAAYRWYKKQAKEKFDVVIDEIHGIPFFTPAYVSEKIVALICEVAREIWDVAFPYPLNFIGRTVENNYFRFYKNIPFLTISPSTKLDLIEVGVEEKRITVLPMGLTVLNNLKIFEREKTPTLLFVSRLTKAKGAEDAISVISAVKKEIHNAKLWIVGAGDPQYMLKLRQNIMMQGVGDNVELFGSIDTEKKFELMSRATILIAPSLKEGWGLTVPEAGYVKTPSVGYNVAGLRDVIVSEQTGLLTDPNPIAMAKEIIRLIQDRALYHKTSFEARKLARTYSWDNTAKTSLSFIQQL